MESRIRSILGNLAGVQEDLVALSDDIWLNIDHNDSEAVKRGAEFKLSYNRAIQRFNEAAAELNRLIQSFTHVSGVPAEPVAFTPAERARRERIIKELDTRMPHYLEEDFSYKRPFGFELEEVPYTDLTAWQHVYEAVCGHLAKKDRSRFLQVPDDPAFISSRGKKYFSRDPGELRDAREFVSGIFAEVNLSANAIRDNIKRLLNHFSIPQKQFVAYFREDRDADHVAG